MKIFLSVFALLILASGLGYVLYHKIMPDGSGAAVEDTVTPKIEITALGLIRQNPELSRFAELLEKVGLTEAVDGTGPVTVFAPTNAAFENMPETLSAFVQNEQNTALLKDLLSYHIIPGTILSTYLGEDAVNVAALESRAVRLQKTSDGQLLFNNAPAVQTNLLVRNGVVHVTGTVHPGPFQNAPASLLAAPPEATPPQQEQPEPAAGQKEE